MDEENTSSPGLRELSKADSQSSVACIRKLRSEYVEGEGVLLRKKSGKSQLWTVSIPRGHWHQRTQYQAYKTVSLSPWSSFPLGTGEDVRNCPKKWGRQCGRRERAADGGASPTLGFRPWSRPELGKHWRFSFEHVWNFEIVLHETGVMWLQAWTGLFYKFSPQLFIFWCLFFLLNFQLQFLKLSSPETVWSFLYLLNNFNSLLFLAYIFKPLFYFFKSVKQIVVLLCRV